MSVAVDVRGEMLDLVTREERLERKWRWRALIGVTFCYLFYYTGRQNAGLRHSRNPG